MQELDFKKMTVEAVRQILVHKYGYTKEQADNLSPKSVAVAKLEQLMADDDILNNVTVVDDNIEIELEDDDRLVFNPQDPNWTKTVLSKLRDDELIDGAPKCDGLRRLVELIFGPIHCCTSEVLQCPSPDNNFSTVVKVRVEVGNQVIDGSADSSDRNLKGIFKMHPVATCETKAESRAYRKLLRLTNTISAEEKINSDEVFNMGETISEMQLGVLGKVCEKNNVNVHKFLESQEIDPKKLDRVSHSRAADILNKLNDLAMTKLIPDTMLDYDKNWR